MRSRTARVTAGALAIAAPSSAVALAADQVADAQGALQLKPIAAHLDYGQSLVLDGRAPSTDAGQRLALEFASGGSAWHALAYTNVGGGGAFRLRARLTRSGRVRVAAVSPIAESPVRGGHPKSATTSAPPTFISAPATLSASGAAGPANSPTSASAAAGSGAASGTLSPTGAPLAPSPAAAVAVAAKLIAPSGTVQALGSQPLELRGLLLPGRAGRAVRLQGRVRHGWRTLAVARTRSGGRFVLHYLPSASPIQSVRLSFAGDGANGPVVGRTREIVHLEPALASWYYDAGNTACGFHAVYGIANKYLPCGTKVVIGYHGRTVTAVVDDRGPFVPGREYDLNQNLAATLGFGGVDTVWSVIAPAAPAAPHRARHQRHRRHHVAPASTGHHRTTSAVRRSLIACAVAASPTSTWTRSTCPSSFAAVPSFAAKPSWWPAPARARS
jgi:hypothetical protein